MVFSIAVPARYAHPDDFARLAGDFPEPRLAALLGVDKKTIRRWLSGAARIPWACFQLVFEHSRYGLAERDSAEHFNRTMLLQLNEALQTQVQELRAELARQARLIDWGCANDPFILPTDPRSTGKHA